MKYKFKKTLILTIILMIYFCLMYMNYSVDAVDFSKAKAFIEEGSKSNMGLKDLSTIGQEFADIGSVLTYIGAGILVGAMTYMGVLYIISSPEKQAKLKQQLIGLVVSAVVIFGAYAIWSFVVGILQDTIG